MTVRLTPLLKLIDGVCNITQSLQMQHGVEARPDVFSSLKQRYLGVPWVQT